MKKSVYLVSVLAVFMALSFAVFAQEAEDALPEAGLTPASPFHVFERFGDWARLNVFTFNAERKAEIKVEIADKRLAELKAVVDAGAGESVIERAELFVRQRTEGAAEDLERLDNQGRNTNALIEKFNALSLRQQSVLEDVLDKAPEQAQEALNRALENSRRGLERTEEVLKRQVEKGLIEEEKAKEIFERTIERLKEQAERRSEHLAELEEELGDVPEEVKARFEVKLKYLEGRLVNVETKEELKSVRENLKLEIKDTAAKVLELRARHELQDEVGDEILRDIEHNRLDVAQKAKRVMEEAEKNLTELKNKVARLEEEGKKIPDNVREHARNAEEHLAKAREAFSANDFGEAFGQANSSLRNSTAAIRFIEAMLRREAAATNAADTASSVKDVVRPIDRRELEQKQEERRDEIKEEVKLDGESPVEIKPTEIQSVRPVELKPDANTSVFATDNFVRVRYTASGFEPKEVKVRVGGTVVWVNESGTAVWPASAVHPTHSVYPARGGCISSAFDACRRIENGGTYQFRFDEAGTWRYHNHLNPGMVGAVTVVE